MADILILNVAFNKNYNINIYAGDYPEVIGGTFMGSSFCLNEGRIQVNAKQVLNLNALKVIEDYYKMGTGVAVFHELLEAVIGAIKYPGANPPEQKHDKEGNIVTDSDAYNNSHNRAKKLDQRFIEPIIEFDENDNLFYLLPQENEKGY